VAKEWSASEEKELMRGIGQVLRDMLVPELREIALPLDSCSQTLARIRAEQQEYRSRRQSA
jgi:hypothetical protein